jgi:hypothetical protein
MRRSDKNRLLLAVAIIAVLWFVLTRLGFHIVVALSLGQFLLFIAIGIALLYVLLKIVF